jgi:hypothetical protein
MLAVFLLFAALTSALQKATGIAQPAEQSSAFNG